MMLPQSTPRSANARYCCFGVPVIVAASITRYSFASSQPMFFECRSGGLRCRPRASEDGPRSPGGLHHARGDCTS